MKQFNLQMPDWQNIDWKSPINLISVASVFGAILYAVYPEIIIYGGIYNYPVWFFGFLGELLLYSFLHGWFFHLLSNVIFFLFIGRVIEYTHGKKWTWKLWWWTTVFVGIFLYLFSENPTIGGSGFAMSLLAVYAYDFYKHKQHEDLKWAIFLIVINLVLGFSWTVSFMGHFAGAIAGWAYAWYMHKHAHKHFGFFR
jgi:membrane associated rhomboid family serine protease